MHLTAEGRIQRLSNASDLLRPSYNSYHKSDNVFYFFRKVIKGFCSKSSFLVDPAVSI